MKIHELMSPLVECIVAQHSLAEAARKMEEQGVGALPVIDDGETVGLVTDRDLVVRGLAAGRDPETTPVGEVMTSDVAWVGRDDEVEQAARTMEERRVRRVLVRDDKGRIGGLLSLDDLARDPSSESLAARVLTTICRADRGREPAPKSAP